MKLPAVGTDFGQQTFDFKCPEGHITKFAGLASTGSIGNELIDAIGPLECSGALATTSGDKWGSASNSSSEFMQTFPGGIQNLKIDVLYNIAIKGIYFNVGEDQGYGTLLSCPPGMLVSGVYGGYNGIYGNVVYSLGVYCRPGERGHTGITSANPEACAAEPQQPLAG